MTLIIYTINLYHVLEKYKEEELKAYYFKFQHKHVAAGNGISHPDDWQPLESKLSLSRFFAYPYIAL